MRSIIFTAVLALAASATSAIGAPDPVEEQHDYLRSRTIGIPSWIGAGADYQPSTDDTRSTTPAQAVYAMPLDGGMRPKFVSVEVASTATHPASTPITVTVVVLDHSTGAKQTRSVVDVTSSSSYHWLDVAVDDLLGTGGAQLPRASQATMTVRIEYGGGSQRTRRVVMFYDRPVGAVGS